MDYFFQIRRRKTAGKNRKAVSAVSWSEITRSACSRRDAQQLLPRGVYGGVSASSRRGLGCGRRGDDSGRALPAPPLLAARRPRARRAGRAAARSCRDAGDFKSPADVVYDSHTATRGDHATFTSFWFSLWKIVMPAMLSRISNLLKT